MILRSFFGASIALCVWFLALAELSFPVSLLVLGGAIGCVVKLEVEG